MDNDNKVNSTEIEPINNQRHKEVLLFLDEELKSIQEGEILKTYNLNEEYSKTKKNKSWFALIALISCCLGVGLMSFILNRVISKQNEKITVNLSEFDDLNLKGLLDNVAKAQRDYDQAFKTKLTLEAALESGLKDANSQMENDIFVLDNLKIKSKKEYDNRRAEIVKANALAQKQLHDEYDEQIIVAEKELATYKEALDKFDTQKIQSAKEQEKAVNSERKLRELEQKELREKYEAQIADLKKQIETIRSKNSDDMHSYMNELVTRYEAELAALDPVLRDSKASEIITYTKTDSAAVVQSEVVPEAAESEEEETEESEEPVEKKETFAAKRSKADFNINNFIEENGITNKKMINALNEYQSFYNDYNYLDTAILGLPHKNSIPEYVTASRVLVNEMGEALADSAADMYKENKELGEKVNNLNADLAKQKNLLEQEKAARQADAENYEDKIIKTEDFYNATLESVMTAAKANAVIISAESADNIKVFVAAKVRDSVTEEGVPAEVKAGKVTVKGNIVKANDRDFIFTPGLDKDGNPLEFDCSLIVPGTAIKTSLK